MSQLMEIKVPDLGGSADVPVIEIAVAVGETIAVDDTLLTRESDKATMDIPRRQRVSSRNCASRSVTSFPKAWSLLSWKPQALPLLHSRQKQSPRLLLLHLLLSLSPWQHLLPPTRGQPTLNVTCSSSVLALAVIRQPSVPPIWV